MQKGHLLYNHGHVPILFTPTNQSMESSKDNKVLSSDHYSVFYKHDPIEGVNP